MVFLFELVELSNVIFLGHVPIIHWVGNTKLYAELVIQ